MSRFWELGEAEVLAALRVGGLFEHSKTPSLTGPLI